MSRPSLFSADQRVSVFLECITQCDTNKYRIFLFMNNSRVINNGHVLYGPALEIYVSSSDVFKCRITLKTPRIPHTDKIRLQDILDDFLKLGTQRTSSHPKVIQAFMDHFSKPEIKDQENIKAFAIKALAGITLHNRINIVGVALYDAANGSRPVSQDTRILQDIYEFHIKTSQATIIQKHFRRWLPVLKAKRLQTLLQCGHRLQLPELPPDVWRKIVNVK